MVQKLTNQLLQSDTLDDLINFFDFLGKHDVKYHETNVVIAEYLLSRGKCITLWLIYQKYTIHFRDI